MSPTERRKLESEIFHLARAYRRMLRCEWRCALEVTANQIRRHVRSRVETLAQGVHGTPLDLGERCTSALLRGNLLRRQVRGILTNYLGS